MSEEVETESLTTVDCTRNVLQGDSDYRSHRSEKRTRVRYLAIASILVVIASFTLSGCDKENIFGIDWNTPTPKGTPAPTSRSIIKNERWEATPSLQATDVTSTRVPEQVLFTTETTIIQTEKGNFSYTIIKPLMGVEIWSSDGKNRLCTLQFTQETTFNSTELITTSDGYILAVISFADLANVTLVNGTCPSADQQAAVFVGTTDYGPYPAIQYNQPE